MGRGVPGWLDRVWRTCGLAAPLATLSRRGTVWARRTRRAVSLLVLGIVAISVAAQTVAERLWPERSGPSLGQPIVIAAGAPSPSVGSPTPTAATAPTQPPPAPTIARPPPSLPPTAAPPTATGQPPTATAEPPTATAPVSVAASAPTVVPTATLAPQSRPATPFPGTSPMVGRVTVVRDEASRPALLREGPSVRSLVVGEVPATTKLELLGSAFGDTISAGNNRWLRVRFDDTIGYIFSGLVE